MSNFNYNKAKFITIFTSQEPYMDAVHKDNKSNHFPSIWDRFVHCKANGFVIVPCLGHEKIRNADYLTIAESVKRIISKLYRYDKNVKVWVGTPIIDCMTYNNIIPYPNNNNTYQRFRDYANFFLNGPYANNIVGFYYNQEGIYTRSFNYSNVINNNPEVTLMSQFSYYVRNSGRKDLIWIPMYGKYNPQGLPVAEVIKRNAYVADTTPIFDCTFFQSSYISNASEGNANFPGITKSMDNGYVCFRDGNRGAIRKTSPSSAIGAEYEWCVVPRDNVNENGGQAALDVYSKHYDRYINKKPLLFYWQNAQTKETMATVLREVYNRFRDN